MPLGSQNHPKNSLEFNVFAPGNATLCQKSNFWRDCVSGDFFGCNFPVLWSILGTKIAPETKGRYSILELKTLFFEVAALFLKFSHKNIEKC